jgi:hypothetical protein
MRSGRDVSVGSGVMSFFAPHTPHADYALNLE